MVGLRDAFVVMRSVSACLAVDDRRGLPLGWDSTDGELASALRFLCTVDSERQAEHDARVALCE